MLLFGLTTTAMKGNLLTILDILFHRLRHDFALVRITNVELERGFQKLGLQRCDMKKICCLVAADGVVDVLEFMRTFSWHDVQNVEKAVYEAKLQVIRRNFFLYL